MTWHTLDPTIRELAERILTEKQLEAWEAVHVPNPRTGDVRSLRGAAVYLGLHRSTFMDRYDAACLNLRHAGAIVDASGHYHLKETA